MPTDHYESAYGSCTTELSIDYTEREGTTAPSQYRAFWCPACGRNHNFRLLPDDEEDDHRLAGAEPETVPDDAERDEDGEAVLVESDEEPPEAEESGVDFTEEGEPEGSNPGGSADESEEQMGLDELDSSDAEGDEVRVESSPIDPGDYTVPELEERLEDESYDWNPASLRGAYEAEVNGKGRSTALEAISTELDQRLAGDD